MDKITVTNMHLSVAGMVYKLSISTKIGCVVLSMFYMLSFIFNPMYPLALTPGYIIPPNFWIWTVVTHVFVETNVVYLFLSFAMLILAGNMLESSWGTVKLLIFYAIVGVTSGLFCGITYLFVYGCTFDTNYLFNVHIYGTCAVIGGIVVALKQKHGDTMLVGSIGLYIRHLPILYLSSVAVLCLINLIRRTIFTQTVTGILIAWIYLRFYESTSRGRGDPSEQFAFKFFFPEVLQAPIGKVTDPIYKFLLKIKVCRKTKYRYDVGAPGNITLSLSGVNSFDAERRRNRAIKALDEHLKKSAEVSQSSWPSLDDDEEAHTKSVDIESSGDGSTSPDIVTIDMKEAQNGNISSS